MSEFGLYIDNKTNPPMVYDEFTRQFMASILAEGYNGTFLIFIPANYVWEHGLLFSCNRLMERCRQAVEVLNISGMKQRQL